MSILASIRKRKSVTQKETAEAIGVPLSTYRAWEYGINNPMSDNIIKLASYFDVTTDEILGREPVSSPLPTLKVMTQTAPLYGAIAAGAPMEMCEYVRHVPIPDQFAENGKEYFYLEVKGGSMNKRIPDGSYALIEVRPQVENGDIAAVIINGYDATLKRWYKTENSLILSPSSYDAKYEDIVLKDSDDDAPYIRVLGRAVWWMAPLNNVEH